MCQMCVMSSMLWSSPPSFCVIELKQGCVLETIDLGGFYLTASVFISKYNKTVKTSKEL